MKKAYIVLLIGISLILSNTVQAETVSFNISPSVTNVVAKPGTAPVISLRLENKGDPSMLKIGISGFKPVDKYGHVELLPRLTNLEYTILESGFRIDEPFFMKSNTSQVFHIQMKLPADIEEKDYYYTITALTIPFPSEEGKTTATLSHEVGSHVILSVSKDGHLDKKAAIPLFAVPKHLTIPFLSQIPVYDSSESIPVLLSVQNIGKNAIKPTNEIKLVGWNIRKTYPITSTFVLSDSQRLLKDIDCTACKADESYHLKEFLIGKYDIAATIYLYQKASYVTSVTSFFVFPFKAALLVIITAVAILVFRFKLKK